MREKFYGLQFVPKIFDKKPSQNLFSKIRQLNTSDWNLRAGPEEFSAQVGPARPGEFWDRVGPARPGRILNSSRPGPARPEENFLKSCIIV